MLYLLHCIYYTEMRKKKESESIQTLKKVKFEIKCSNLAQSVETLQNGKNCVYAHIYLIYSSYNIISYCTICITISSK